jgi:hypothetical protein
MEIRKECGNRALGNGKKREISDGKLHREIPIPQKIYFNPNLKLSPLHLQP